MWDLDLREKLAVAPLIAIVIILGFYPAPVLNVLEPFVASTMQQTGATDPLPTVPVAQEGGQP
jgi:NADH-quinone oxidoreductase subunit M